MGPFSLHPISSSFLVHCNLPTIDPPPPGWDSHPFVPLMQPGSSPSHLWIKPHFIIWAGHVKNQLLRWYFWTTIVRNFWLCRLCCFLRTLLEFPHFVGLNCGSIAVDILSFSNTQVVIPTSVLKVTPWVLFSGSFLHSFLVQQIAVWGYFEIFFAEQ